MTQRFYDPARNGTMTILESASKVPSVRRVVITSSIVILEPSESEFGTGRKPCRPPPFWASLTSKSIRRQKEPSI